MPHANCFTLRVDTVRPGIDIVPATETFPMFVRLCAGREQMSIPLRLRSPNLCVDGNNLFRARPIPGTAGNSELCDLGSWDGILLRINATMLRFRFQSFSRELNLWVGGDKKPFAQVGHRKSSSKDQLIILKPGEVLPVIDFGMRIAIVQVPEDGSTPTIRPASKEDVCQYVADKGVSQGTVPSCDWALRILNILGGHEEVRRVEQARLALLKKH